MTTGKPGPRTEPMTTGKPGPRTEPMTTGKPGPRTEPMTAAGKRLVTDHQSGGNDRACLMSVGLLEDRIAEAEEQAATEADLRLLVMTTARDAAVVEADRLREAATEARRELLAALPKALIDLLATHDWGVYDTSRGGASWVDRRRVGDMLAAALIEGVTP